MEPTLTVTEVARLLGVCNKTVLKHINAKAFRNAFKLDDSRRGEWRIPQSSYEEFVRNRQAKAQA